MKRFRDEFDVLFECVTQAEGEMARELLQSGGIPSMLQGADFDVAELGVSVHSVLRPPMLLVPRGARAAARALIAEAWGDERVTQLETVRRA